MLENIGANIKTNKNDPMDIPAFFNLDFSENRFFIEKTKVIKTVTKRTKSAKLIITDTAPKLPCIADISIYSSPCPIITPRTIKAKTANKTTEMFVIF